MNDIMKYVKRFAFLWLMVVLFSCNKDTIVDTPTQVGISTITHYVVLTLIGPSFESTVAGQPYTDSGVTATENGVPVKYTTTGTVDVNTVGLYVVNYSATNQDGYSSTISRTVAVIPSAPVPGVDLSGTYANVGAAPLTADISVVAPGVYYTTNCWGGTSLAVIQAYFFCPDGANIVVPAQSYSPYGPLDGSGTYNAGLINWNITLEAQGPFTAAKSWQKQ
jgi:Domain of unknown function (DUF5011)